VVHSATRAAASNNAGYTLCRSAFAIQPAHSTLPFTLCRPSRACLLPTCARSRTFTTRAACHEQAQQRRRPDGVVPGNAHDAVDGFTTTCATTRFAYRRTAPPSRFTLHLLRIRLHRHLLRFCYAGFFAACRSACFFSPRFFLVPLSSTAS